MGLHNRHTMDQYQLSPRARGVLAVVEGAGEPLEPSVIAERLVVTTGSMTSLLDNLENRGLVRRRPHPSDRRKLLIDITPEAQTIVDEFLPANHGGWCQRRVAAPGWRVDLAPRESLGGG
jgi:MarR family transcriptional regulator, organic hydroperoxide resistance regulator